MANKYIHFTTLKRLLKTLSMMYMCNALPSTLVFQGVPYQLINIEMRLNKIMSF